MDQILKLIKYQILVAIASLADFLLVLRLLLRLFVRREHPMLALATSYRHLNCMLFL